MILIKKCIVFVLQYLINLINVFVTKNMTELQQ